jgi:son of sevenless-like protein
VLQVGTWVVSEILLCNDKQRKKLFKKMVKVALECKKLNNFHGAFELAGALQNAAIHRLKKLQDCLPTDLAREYEELKQLSHPQKSWKEYREYLHKVNPPCVPFIG